MREIHEKYMQKAIALAQKGVGFVNPNPLVGAVLVKNDSIIGAGYHRQFGQAHAEVEALREATESPEGATLYVTLEPCSHYGKTPPCAVAIVESKIAKVIVATLDPNPLVRGNGVKLLRENGIEVEVGILEKEAREQNKVFLKYIVSKSPYVLMKWAMTLDGKIATLTGDSRWVSGEQSRQMVHELRHEFRAIMVGIGTVLADDPLLNCRKEGKVSHPIRIVLDSRLRIPLDSKLVQTAAEYETIVATGSNCDLAKKQKLEKKGIVVLQTSGSQVVLTELMQQLGERGIDGILLEGGARVNAEALRAGIVDEVWTFVASKIVGGQGAATPVGGQGVSRMQDAYELEYKKIEQSGDDWLLKARVKK